MKNLSKNKELEGDTPSGFFVGCPEQEFHMEIKENLNDCIENVDG